MFWFPRFEADSVLAACSVIEIAPGLEQSGKCLFRRSLLTQGTMGENLNGQRVGYSLRVKTLHREAFAQELGNLTALLAGH
jgi:hypothetical protein